MITVEKDLICVNEIFSMQGINLYADQICIKIFGKWIYKVDKIGGRMLFKDFEYKCAYSDSYVLYWLEQIMLKININIIFFHTDTDNKVKQLWLIVLCIYWV